MNQEKLLRDAEAAFSDLEPSPPPPPPLRPTQLVRKSLIVLLLAALVVSTGMHSIGWGGRNTSEISPAEHRKHLSSSTLPDELKCNSAHAILREMRDNIRAYDTAIENGGRSGADSERFLEVIERMIEKVREKARKNR